MQQLSLTALTIHITILYCTGQVGKGSDDHAFWGRPEDMYMKRPSYKIDKENPGEDLAT